MQEFPVTTVVLSDETGQMRTFRYSLLVEEITQGPFFCENYGLKVAEDGGETQSFSGVTISQLRFETLLRLVVRNKVGPSTIADVIADWL